MAKPKKPGTGVSNRRRKELAAAKLERQSARRAQRHATHRRRMRIGWSLAALLAVVALTAVVLWPSGSNDASDAVAADTDGQVTTVTLPGCDPAPTPPQDVRTWDSAPEMALDKGGLDLVLDTNCGEIVIATKPGKAPETVNAMAWLAEAGYFDSTLCHRLSTGGLKVLQCGDPTATGDGEPGFTLPDENLPEAGEGNYPAGTVAMANSGADTAGSQFFIVYEDSTLPPSYTIWGRVSSGLDVVRRIAEAGVLGGGTDGWPAAAIGIEEATAQPQG